MTPRALVAGLLLCTLLAACGEKRPPAEEGLVDPRPRWTVGETLRIREERERRGGTGLLPPAGDLLARTRSIEHEVAIYEDTVLEAEGTRLGRVRRTYLRSFRTVKGEDEPTALAGKTYEITDPFADRTFRMEVVAADGTRRKAPVEEEKLVRVGLLRLAASLLPGRPVRPGGSWKPGRALSQIGIPGESDASMTARLSSIRDIRGEGRYATIESQTDVRSRAGVQISMRESVIVGLDDGRLQSYRGLTEFYNTPGPSRPETWRRVSATLTISPIGH